MSKSVLAGAALAAVAGIMLGGAMQPQLVFDGRPLGPQMMAAGGGARANDPSDQSAAYASYRANIPDYVTGTDYVQAAYAPQTAPAEDERQQIAREDDPPPPAPVAYTRATYDEPRTEVVYPSVYGGAPYERQAPAPSAPPEDDAPLIVG